MNNLRLVNKDDITVLIAAHNYSFQIGKTVKHFKTIGYNNILVIDDASRDSTGTDAIKAGAKVKTNELLMGFNMATLRGLYNVKTNNVLVIEPDMITNKAVVDEFLEFAIKGNYGMLISKYIEGTNRYTPYISKFLKKRFGIFIDEPSFQAIYLNENTLELIRTKNLIEQGYLYYSLMALVIKNELKIGTYNFGELPMRTRRTRGRVVWVSSKPNGLRMRLNRFLRQRRIRKMNSHSEYFKFTFPELDRLKSRRTFYYSLITAVIVAVIGLVVKINNDR